MPVPSAITDLSTTAASNSPAGSENVFPNLDDYIRALSAFIAQNYANKLAAASPVWTGQMSGALGSVGAPAYSFTGDLNTGRYSPAADRIRDVTGGVSRFEIGANGETVFGDNQSPNNAIKVGLAGTGLAQVSARGFRDSTVVSSSTTTDYQGYSTNLSTTAAAFTLTSLLHFQAVQSTIGAGSAVTNQAGFQVASSLTGATNNFGFRGQIGSGANRWNVYMDGTAQNWFAGNVGVGAGKSAPTNALEVAGVMSADTIYAGSGGVGYTTGSGSTATQATSKSTGVTLNNITGQITMNGAALAASTSVSFLFTNSTIAAADLVIVNIKSGATSNSYVATVEAVSAGSCRIQLRNVSGGSLSEAVVLSFAVIKGATA